MKPSVRNWLVALALVCTIVSEFATCATLEFELREEEVSFRDPEHDLSSSRSSPGQWATSFGSSEDEVLGGFLRGRNSAGRVWKNYGGRMMIPGTELSFDSGQKDVLMISAGRGDLLRGSNRGIWADRASVITESRRVSRSLLQQSSLTCPLDFRGMKDFHWYINSCQQFYPHDSNSSCCFALTSALGQAEAQYLRNAGDFRLKDNATVGACMASLNAELQSEDNAFNNIIVPTCFPESNYSRFVSQPSNCQGIQTRSEFERLAGSSINTTLNPSCSGSLIDLQLCQICTEAMYSVIRILSAISSNSSDCLAYTLFYAAGISNLDGPLAQGTAQCILSVKLAAPPMQSNSTNLAQHIGIGAAAAFAASLIFCALFFCWWKRRRNAAHRAFIERNTRLLKPAMMRPNTGLIEYSYEEIKAATNSFSSKNYIGSGGFGDVYQGMLDDGLEVAVKRMKNCSSEGDANFINEVNVINSVRHRNLVILRGCCVTSTDADGHQRLLVYDYMSNGSLYDYLFGTTTATKKKPVLAWADRRRLAIGMAKGIVYLHNDARPPIIHRDIKASNVLLDENLDAKVADFGLAQFTYEGQTQVVTAAGGTLGYVAPEYALYGQLTEKSDVYSFGVVLLELMSGRRALDGVDGNYSLLTDWAWAMVKEGNLVNIVDERIRRVGPRDVMERFVLVGILCAHMLVAFRPSMEDALRYLEGDVPLPHIPNRPMPVNSEMPWDAAAATAPPAIRSPSINIAAAVDALSTPGEEESEVVRLHREHRAAMSEFSGTSAGVNAASLLR